MRVFPKRGSSQEQVLKLASQGKSPFELCTAESKSINVCGQLRFIKLGEHRGVQAAVGIDLEVADKPRYSASGRQLRERRGSDRRTLQERIGGDVEKTVLVKWAVFFGLHQFPQPLVDVMHDRFCGGPELVEFLTFELRIDPPEQEGEGDGHAHE